MTMGNSNTIAAPVSANSWGANALIPTPFGSATAKASKAPRSTDTASKPSVVTLPKQLAGFVPGCNRADVPISPNQNHHAPPDKALTLTESTQAAFEAALKRWHEQYAAFLNERSMNGKTGHSLYTHRRLRTAYISLKRHPP